MLTVIQSVACLALTAVPTLAQGEFGLFDLVGEVTYVAPHISSSSSSIAPGDLLWCEFTIDLESNPVQGPGSSLHYAVADPSRVSFGQAYLAPAPGTSQLTITDGPPLSDDRLDLEQPVQLLGIGGSGTGTLHFSYVDPSGNAWASPLIDAIPSPLVPATAAGQTASFDVFDSTGLLLIHADVSTVGLDLSSETTRICWPVTPNSGGLPGRLTGIGPRTVADNDFSILADRLSQHSFGFFVVSDTPGYIPNPGGMHGRLCLSGSIGRYVGPGQVGSSGASGTMQLSVDLTQIPNPVGPITTVAGDTWYFQLWHRDTSHNGPNSNFTDSIGVQFH